MQPDEDEDFVGEVPDLSEDDEAALDAAEENRHSESIFESVWNELFEDHGPPPSPGLVFDETKHRWVRPEEQADAIKKGGSNGNDKKNPELKKLATMTEDEYIDAIGGATGEPSNIEYEPSQADWYEDTTHITDLKTNRGEYEIRKNNDGNYFAYSKEEIDAAAADEKGMVKAIGYFLADKHSTQMAVKGEFNGEGIATELAYQFRKEHPFQKSGGLSTAGEAVARKVYKRIKKEASSFFEDRGPPPHPGLVFDETSHRWVRPSAGDSPASHAAPKSQTDTLQAVANELGDEAKKPGMIAKIKTAFVKVWDAVHVAAIGLAHKLHDLAPDILDVASDYSKIFYAGKGSGRGETPDPFTESMGLGASTVAVVASHILGRASVWIRSKLSGRKQEAVAGTLSIEQKAKAVADLLHGLNKEMGVDLQVDEAAIATWLKGQEGAK